MFYKQPDSRPWGGQSCPQPPSGGSCAGGLVALCGALTTLILSGTQVLPFNARSISRRHAERPLLEPALPNRCRGRAAVPPVPPDRDEQRVAGMSQANKKSPTPIKPSKYTTLRRSVCPAPSHSAVSSIRAARSLRPQLFEIRIFSDAAPPGGRKHSAICVTFGQIQPATPVRPTTSPLMKRSCKKRDFASQPASATRQPVARRARMIFYGNPGGDQCSQCSSPAWNKIRSRAAIATPFKACKPPAPSILRSGTCSAFGPKQPSTWRASLRRSCAARRP